MKNVLRSAAVVTAWATVTLLAPQPAAAFGLWEVILHLILEPTPLGDAEVHLPYYNPTNYESILKTYAGTNSVSSPSGSYTNSYPPGSIVWPKGTSHTNSTPQITGYLGASAKTNYYMSTSRLEKSSLSKGGLYIDTTTAGSTNEPVISPLGSIIEGAINDISGVINNKVFFVTSPEPIQQPLGVKNINESYKLEISMEITAVFDTFTAGSECVSGEYDVDLFPIVSTGPVGAQVCANSGLPSTIVTPPQVYNISIPTGSIYDLVVKTKARAISTPVPAPLPLLGLGAAFGYSRKLRRLIDNSKTLDVMRGQQ